MNLSARQLFDGALVETVLRLLQEGGIEPRRLDLEITESALMKDPDTAVAVLGELRSKGVRISVDDFGVGYSSLSHLRRLPVDGLKIDRVFVREVGEDPVNGAIVRAVISMAHGMGLDVTAEGVETAEELAFVRAQRCDRAQGHYFSRALPAAAAGEMLPSGPRWT